MNKRNIFLKLFISYFCIILIPLATCSLVYIESQKIVTENARNQNILMLGQVKDILDARLEEVEAISHQIAVDKRVISVLNVRNYKEGSADYYRIWDLCNNLPNYKLTNQLILELFIFLKRSSVTICSNSAYASTDTLYGKAFSYGKLNYIQWNDLLWKTFYNQKYLPTSNIKIDGNENPVICYMQSIPYNSISNAQGVVAVMINERTIETMLRRFDIGDTGMVYITDEEGNVQSCISGKSCSITPAEIQSSISENKQSPSSVVVSTVRSDFNMWTYVSVIPEDIILAKVQYIKKLMLIMILISLLSGGVAAFLLTYRKANILAKITGRVTAMIGPEMKPGNNNDTFSIIDNAVSKLILNKIELENSIKEQAPLLEAAMLRMLLYGEISGANTQSMFEIFHDNVNSNLVVTKIYFESDNLANSDGNFSDYSRTNAIIKDLMNHIVDKRHYLLDVGHNTIAMIVFFGDGETEKAKPYMVELLEQTWRELERLLDIQVYFALSEIHQGLGSSSIAYEECGSVIDYMHFYKGQKVIWYSEIPKGNEFYYYPVDLELRLIGMVKSGDTTSVKKLLHDIYVENFEKRQLSSEMLQQLMYSMKGTVIRGLGGMSYDQTVHEFINTLYKTSNIDEIFNSVVRANIRISMAMNNMRKNKQNGLKEQVIEYLQENYRQSELTLDQLAEYLGYTESFLYQFFKDNVGSTFADYLENLRINQACELLMHKDVTVKGVSEKVGYNSDNSFRRAFKRIMGVSPSEYVQATNPNE